MECVILFTIDDLFTMNVYMMGMGENPRNKINECEKQGQIPRLVTLPSPRLRNRGLLFSGVRKHRKLAEPTLSGRGFLI